MQVINHRASLGETRLHWPALLLAAWTIGLPGAARGELLQFEILGEITIDIDPDNDFPDISLGDQFAGLFRYDTDTPEVGGGTDPNFGAYVLSPPFVPLSFLVDGTTFETSPDQPPDISVGNNFPDPVLGDIDVFQLFGTSIASPPSFGGTTTEIGMILLTTNTSVLADVSLPTQFNVDDWQDRIIFFGGTSSRTGGTIDIQGNIEWIIPVAAGPELMAGDADQDLDFDQLDLVRVQIAARYLHGQSASWGEGDWNGAPGGSQGNPPPGDGLFDQLDIIAALRPGHYLSGPYAAIGSQGRQGDGQTSIGYSASTGEVWVDAPAGTQLTSINIDSAAGIFTGGPAQNLGGSFDHDADSNLFKATFGSSFGSLSFGRVAQPGLGEQFLQNDLSVIGSLAGGGGLGAVDLIYVPVPEPAGFLLSALGLLCGLGPWSRRAWA
jgi:hypothetical protein